MENLNELNKAIDRFLTESKPYSDAISRIEETKPVKFLINTSEGTFTRIQTEDTETQKLLKENIEHLREKHLGKFKPIIQ